VKKNHSLGIAILVVIALIGQSSASVANAANTVGKKCTKIGKTSTTSGGVELVCAKSGKKIVWKKRFIPTVPTVIDLAMTTTLSASSMFADISLCKITDATWPQSVMSLGFPRNSGFELSKKNFKGIVIPISFSDATYNSSDEKILAENLKKVSEYYFAQSYGQVSIDFVIPEPSKWVVFSGNRSDHGFGLKVPQENKEPFVREVLSKTDPDLNIGNYDLVVIESARWQGLGWAQGLAATSISTPSGFTKSIILEVGSTVGIWQIIAHEIGHAFFGFEDLYSFAWIPENVYVDDGNKNWDLMADPTAGRIELFSWQRFLSSWIKDEQVACAVKPGKYNVFLSPLAKYTTNNKSVVIPIENGTVLVAESRKYLGYDERIPAEGTLVYVVDTKINHGSEPIKVLKLLGKGETLTYKNVEITSLDSNSTGELVSVKIN
jgi:M6 family metalloprotease-like protein